jgi:DNA-binding HxlR family transcriptional regulator
MIPQSVAEIVDNHVTLKVEGIDRLYLHAYIPKLRHEQGAAFFFRDHRQQIVASSALMVPMSRSFVAALDRFAVENKVPVVLFQKGQRKDDIMKEHLKEFSATEGVVFIGKAQEKASVYRTEKRHSAETDKSYVRLVRSTAMVNHYYIYAVDRDFGPFFLKFCTYFPFNAKLCINGHEYAKRQLALEGIPFEALDNGVLSCGDPERLQEICDGLSPEKIDGLLRKWLRLLPHPFTGADRQAGYRYDLSILQAEFSTTQVLDRPVHGRIFFEQVIRENLDIGRPEDVQLIFQRRITKRTPGSFRTRIVTEGVTPTLNVHYKNARIKQYHKEQRALRTETTINNARDFGIGKAAQSAQPSRDWLCGQPPPSGSERLSHDCILAEDSFRQINGPIEQNGQRASGLRFADPRIQFLWQAVILFRLQVNGFRAADLRQHLAALSGRNPSDISQGALTYQLRRLRLHGIIEKVANSFRYRITASGFRAAPFFTRAYNRLLRPGLAGALPDHYAADGPLKRAFDKVETSLAAWLQQQKLAA